MQSRKYYIWSPRLLACVVFIDFTLNMPDGNEPNVGSVNESTGNISLNSNSLLKCMSSAFVRSEVLVVSVDARRNIVVDGSGNDGCG